jgi:DNA helicase-2/ATP-dependent DNA helicase PcrA
MQEQLFPADWTSAAPAPVPAAQTRPAPAPAPPVPVHMIADAVAADDRVADLLTGLNPAQHAAVRNLTGPVLVVAGPGSGKTRVLTHRVAALVRLGVPAWQIMAVTFTNKAAGEMRERIAAMVGDAHAADMWVSTFHSACVRILRKYHTDAGLPRSFTILDANDVQKVLKTILVENGRNTEAGAVRELASVISRAKNNARTPAQLAGSPRMQERDVAPMYTAYQQRLKNMGAVDFDDLLTLAVDVLTRSPEALEWIRKRARYLLVDEVQDTNAVQVALLRLINPPGSTTRPAAADLTGTLRAAAGNVCFVGDTDQAIYSWRAANPAGLLDYWAEFRDGTVVVLEQNYRSTKAILEVVRALIAPNPALHRPRLFTDNPHGDPVRLYVAEDDRDEADWVIAQIRGRGGRLDEHAVLFRTNAQTRVFEEALTRNAMPYQVVGALRFYDRAEIKDALSYLRVAVNPADEVNLARCINTPRRGIGDATVNALISAARAAGTDPITHLRASLTAGTVPKRSVAALTGFLTVYDQIRAACHNGPEAALRTVAGPAGLHAELAKDKQQGPDRIDNLNELITAAGAFQTGTSTTSTEAGPVAGLDGWDQTIAYLENVALVSAADIGDEETAIARISLLTAHASKGKEFVHVYVAGVEHGLYPHERSKDDDTAIEEERRLLFVACSRAEKTLTISRCLSRFMFNRPQANPPSPFLDDLPGSVQVITSKKSATSWSATRNQASRPSAATWQPDRYQAGRSTTPATATRPGTTPRRPVAPAGPRLTHDQLPGGTLVHHVVFGAGEVVTSSPGKAEIRFGTTSKVLDLTMAPLTLT